MPEQPKPQAVVNPTKIHFGCIFSDTTVNVDCADLEKSLRETDLLVTFVSKEESEFDLELSELPDSPFEKYELKVTDHTGQVVPATYVFSGSEFRLRATLTPISKISQLSKAIMAAILPYQKIMEYKYNPQGQLLLTVVPKAGAVAPPAAKMSPIYVQASGFGMLISQGSSLNIMAMPTVTAGYTDIGPDHQGWLVEFSNSTRYNYISTSVTVPEVVTNSAGNVVIDPSTGKPKVTNVNVPEMASNLNVQNGLVVARSISKHWAIAAFLRDNTDPSSNFKNQMQAHVGIEYELLPYLITNDDALTINYLIGGNHQTYYSPNMNGQMVQNIATHALSVYYVFHFNRLDVNGSVAGTSTVGDFKQWGLGGQLGGRIYLNKKKTFTFDPSVNFGIKNNLVNNPANPSSQYQILELMGVGSGSTPNTTTVRLGFTYRFGPNLVRQKDTRWQFTSDEVPNNF